MVPALRVIVAAAAALLLAAACSPDEPDPAAAPTPDVPTAAPQGPIDPGTVPLDPCALLTAEEVSGVVGQEVGEGGLSGGEVFQLCSYQLPDGLNTVDVALVDLERLAQVSDEAMDGDGYIESLREGAGAGIVAHLPDVGDGDALTIAYSGGSQAWAWFDGRVVGAYADSVPDPIETAVDLLQAALAKVDR